MTETISTQQYECLLSFQRTICNEAIIQDYHQCLQSLCWEAAKLVPNAHALVLSAQGKRWLLEACSSELDEVDPTWLLHLENNRFERPSRQQTVVHLLCLPNTQRHKILLGVTGYQAHQQSLFVLAFSRKHPVTTFENLLVKSCTGLLADWMHRRQKEQVLWQVAHTDPVTGFDSRKLLAIKCDAILNQAQKNNSTFATLLLGIETASGPMAIERLQNLADKLQQTLCDKHIVGRIAKSEFLILIEDFKNLNQLRQFCRRMIKALQQEDPLMKLHIGLSLFPQDGTSIELLIQNADIALYKARLTQQNTFFFYQDNLTEEIRLRLLLERQLQEAIDKSQFEIHYQPIYKGHALKLVSLEALLRWNHPRRGLLLPCAFIQAAEESGLINNIGLWVFNKVCWQLQQWLKSFGHAPSIAVNISPAQLQQGFAQKISHIIKKHNIAPQYIEIEVTESVFLESDTQKIAIKELMKIREMGLNITLDDFGTGFSSLSQLKTLPINKLKIDRSFIMELPFSKSDGIIAQAIIDMGKNLKMDVLAEGVETLEQKNFLLEKNCQLMQGFFLSHPLASQDIESLLGVNQNPLRMAPRLDGALPSMAINQTDDAS